MKRRAIEWCWRHPSATVRIVGVPLVLVLVHHAIIEADLFTAWAAVIIVLGIFWGVKLEA